MKTFATLLHAVMQFVYRIIKLLISSSHLHC